MPQSSTPSQSHSASQSSLSTQQESDALASRLGAHPLPDGSGTRFRLWTSTARTVAVRVDGNDHTMHSQGGGIYDLVLPVQPGAKYKFVLDDAAWPDPYARFLPDGVHGEAEVMDLHQYRWQTTDWRGLPLKSCVFYELHIGTFTPEGTYAAAQAKLPYLKGLGITALQLMPLAAFSGERGWGYDGAALYAPYAPYGRPEALMAFVDAAHGLGLGVFLDVVYNHFGPDGNYLSLYSPQYFTDRFSSAWGASLDYAEPHMRRFVTGNARMWLRDYRLDGLRLDATQAMQDDSETHILAELAQEVHRLNGTHLLLAEDYRNLPELVTQHKLDGIWIDDFHHEVRVTLTADQDGYYAPYQGGAAALANTIERGWVFEGQWWPLEDRPRGKPADALGAASFVYFIQNHDQVGNRAIGDRIHHLPQVSPERFRAASMLLLTLPMTPLLFMGQEWAASTPFPFFSDHHGELGAAISEGRKKEFEGFASFKGEDILDPQSAQTFEVAKLHWDEQSGGEHAKTLGLYRQLLKLRKTDPVLQNRDRQNLSAGSVAGDLLWVRTVTDAGERALLWNLGAAELKLDSLSLPFELPGDVVAYSEFLPSPPAGEGPAEQGEGGRVTTSTRKDKLKPGHAVLLGRGA
ncbi:malto-oligosyltrehalose trehalohydrolase [Deinococcus sp.]|uniref:malto-oligosyltrehalose trehalohydrolase n=1 Tax=Deinococcus sp. TaxID=47478 RepID=UPI0025C4EFB4|nr:malto-oligosyltrehalose trehalohydrolase [Deinococcus sp.]